MHALGAAPGSPLLGELSVKSKSQTHEPKATPVKNLSVKPAPFIKSMPLLVGAPSAVSLLQECCATINQCPWRTSRRD